MTSSCSELRRHWIKTGVLSNGASVSSFYKIEKYAEMSTVFSSDNNVVREVKIVREPGFFMRRHGRYVAYSHWLILYYIIDGKRALALLRSSWAGINKLIRKYNRSLTRQSAIWYIFTRFGQFWRRANTEYQALTHWGRVTHICVSKLTIIGSDNGLSPGRRQANI